jgi:hypothetical protein
VHLVRRLFRYSPGLAGSWRRETPVVRRPVVRFACIAWVARSRPVKRPRCAARFPGPVGLPSTARCGSSMGVGDGRRGARSAATAPTRSLKAVCCLRSLGAVCRPAVQAESLLQRRNDETPFVGQPTINSWSARVPTGQHSEIEVRYRRSTQDDAAATYSAAVV